MSVFHVRKRVDAYVDYIAEVEAVNAIEAAQMASDDEDAFDWQEEGHCEFEDRRFVALDGEGGELEATEVTSF